MLRLLTIKKLRVGFLMGIVFFVFYGFLKSIDVINPIDGINWVGYSVDPHNVYFVNQLKQAINDGRTEVSIGELTDFDWDQATFYFSYYYVLGAHDGPAWGINSSYWTAVFKKNDDVTFFRVGVDIADTDNLFIDQDDVMLSLAYDDYHKKIIISIKGTNDDIYSAVY